MPKPNELIPSRGAISERLIMEVTRPITQADIDTLHEAPKTNVPILKNLRAVHHQQAQLLAQGMKLKEVAAIVGCTVQRLVQLQEDPTFKELIETYRDQRMVSLMGADKRLTEKLIDVGEMAVDELRERLEDDSKRSRMRNMELVKITELALDRTVLPPKTTNSQNSPPAAITINFGTPIKTPNENEKPIIDAEVSDDSDL